MTQQTSCCLCFVQDWHQKLHNNTTPDDVAICEAYIKFLEGNGDNGAYWRHLTDNGITRERLESFDRAIKVSFDHTQDLQNLKQPTAMHALLVSLRSCQQ